MIIKSFTAKNFRNIESCEIKFSESVNLLYGNNAEGKTNAIEGIYLFARGKSFRGETDKELIKFGNEGFYLKIDFEDKLGLSELEYSVYGRETRRKKNGQKLSTQRELVGSFRAVLFSPDDLLLVKGSPELRRGFLNVAIGQIKEIYISCYSNYKKALDNRNRILKNAQKGGFCDENELISWSEYMAEYAASIYLLRKEYIKKLEYYSYSFMKEISDGKEDITFEFISDIDGDFNDEISVKNEYKRIFTVNTEKEKAVGTSLYGPQRDDIDIKINGKSSRSFASQGQQRSIVLALKLAEGEVSREFSGEYPVFLLDDVLSELDDKRRNYLISGLKKRQIIMTSCEADREKLMPEKVILVENGKYIEGEI